MKHAQHLLVCTVCSVLVTACGGGSSGTDVRVPERSQSEPLHGFLTIEERSGQRVLDAWFRYGSLSEATGDQIWQSGTQHCDRVSVPGEGSAPVLDWQDTLYAGESITILSRSGEVVRLLPQVHGDAVVYATSERWLSEPLPEDAHLSMAGSGDVPAFGPLGLAPLAPLVRLQPSGGVSLDVSQPLLWEASDESDDAIELTIAGFAVSEVNPGQTVHCRLDDSGEFALPAEVVELLPTDSPVVYTLLRTRHVSHESDGALLHISQSSYP